MSGNGNIVAKTGDLNMRSSGNASSNAVFQVFGIPTNSNLAGLAGKAYDPQDAIIRFTAPTVPTPSVSVPLPMSFFKGYALYASVPTVAVTLLTTTTLTPNFTGGGGTTYYVAIGTSLGESNSQTSAWTALSSGTTALTLAPSLSTGTAYYISGYASNANGTRTLAVSNTTSFTIPAAPTITANVISNTTFTITAAVPANASSNVYSLYTQAGAFQSSNTTGTFTGLTSNTQYYVSVYAASATTRSTSSTSASVWCLAPATFSSVLIPPAGGAGNNLGVVTFTWVNNATSGVTSLTMSINGSNGTAISSTATSAIAYGTSSNIIYNSQNITYLYVSYQFAYNWNTVPCIFKLITSGTNTTYTSQSVYFGYQTGGSNLTLTPTVATTVTLTLGGAGGCSGSDGSAYYARGGIGAGTIISLSVGANVPLKLLIGKFGGQPLIGTNTGARGTAGDGTAGGSGGTAYYTSGYGTAVGGTAGPGGAASIALLNGTTVLICGGGGGGGSGGSQGGDGGGGGTGVCSANSFVPGGEGNANYGNSNYYGHQGGWGGSETISNRAGDWASPDPTTSYAAGAGGGGYRGTVNYVTNTAYGSNGSSWTAAAGGGQGGDGVTYYGANSGGGGGGYGGGGSGTSTNQGSTAISGGGGGGGSWSSVACTFSQYARGQEYGYGFAYWII